MQVVCAFSVNRISSFVEGEWLNRYVWEELGHILFCYFGKEAEEFEAGILLGSDVQIMDATIKRSVPTRYYYIIEHQKRYCRVPKK